MSESRFPPAVHAWSLALEVTGLNIRPEDWHGKTAGRLSADVVIEGQQHSLTYTIINGQPLIRLDSSWPICCSEELKRATVTGWPPDHSPDCRRDVSS